MVARSRWASPARLLVCRRTGLVVRKMPRGPAAYGRSARDGPSAPGERKTKERGSPVCSTRDQCPSVRRARLPNRGVRERPDAMAGCHAAPEGKKSFCCEYREESMPEKLASTSMRVQTARLRLGSRDCGAVKLLSTQIVRKQAKAIFHLRQRGTLHATSSSTLSNSTNGWLTLATAKLERRWQILDACASTDDVETAANSLEIHDARLLKSGASRQEKASACNRNCAATDEHFRHDVVFDRRTDVNAAGTEHLNSLLDDDGLTACGERRDARGRRWCSRRLSRWRDLRRYRTACARANLLLNLHQHE